VGPEGGTCAMLHKTIASACTCTHCGLQQYHVQIIALVVTLNSAHKVIHYKNDIKRFSYLVR